MAFMLEPSQSDKEFVDGYRSEVIAVYDGVRAGDDYYL